MHLGWVNAAAFSPDGSKVVTASADKSARVWDAQTGRLLATCMHEGSVLSVAYSPDGLRFVTASNDNSARIWEAETGRPVGLPLQHDDVVWSAVFSPDSRRIVTASRDKTARFWDAATGKSVSSRLYHQAAVVIAAFSPDGRRVVTASEDKTARIWDLATEVSREATSIIRQQQTTDIIVSPGPQPISLVSPNKQWAVTIVPKDGIRIWDIERGRFLKSLDGHSGTITCARFSPNGMLLVTGSSDGTVREWEVESGKFLTSLEHPQLIRNISISPDSRRVATVCEDGLVRIWDLVTGRIILPVLKHKVDDRFAALDPPEWVGFSPDGRRLFTAGTQRLFLWDASTGESVVPPFEYGLFLKVSPEKIADRGVTQPANAGSVIASVTFSPDSKRILVTTGNGIRASGEAYILNETNGQLMIQQILHQHFVGFGDFSPDSRRVITASWDGISRIWDVATLRPLTQPMRHQGKIKQAQFSSDGRRVTTVSDNCMARIWDAETGFPLSPPLAIEQSTRSIEYHRDGLSIIPIGHDGRISLWNYPTNRHDSDDWAKICAFQTGQRLDSVEGLETVAADQIVSWFHELKRKYPEDFTVTNDLARLWRIGEIGRCLGEGRFKLCIFYTIIGLLLRLWLTEES